MKSSSKRRHGGKLSLFDAKEAIDGAQTPVVQTLTVGASPARGISFKIIDLDGADTYNSVLKKLKKLSMDIRLACSTTNVAVGANLYLVNYITSITNTLDDISASETDEEVLKRQVSGSMRYRRIKTGAFELLPDGQTSGSWGGRTKMVINLMPTWNQIEKLTGEQAGMSLLPDQKFCLIMICRTSTANVGIRFFGLFNREFTARPSENVGL